MAELIDERRLDGLARLISRSELDRMLIAFTERLRESGAALSAAAVASDGAALRNEAHKLAGLASTFGATAVAEGALAVEAVSGEGLPAVAGDDVTALLDLIAATVIRLRES
jgi:HPt (histidine-containing phosphotransfer) domain-containing protein